MSLNETHVPLKEAAELLGFKSYEGFRKNFVKGTLKGLEIFRATPTSHPKISKESIAKLIYERTVTI